MKFKVFCRYEEFANRLSFYVFSTGPTGARQICTSLDEMNFVDYEEGTMVDPTFSLTGLVVKPFLKEMANALKQIGIRADDEPILENELAAVKYHLEDMRTLVFKTE